MLHVVGAGGGDGGAGGGDGAGPGLGDGGSGFWLHFGFWLFTVTSSLQPESMLAWITGAHTYGPSQVCNINVIVIELE